MSLVNSSFAINVTPGAMPPVVHVSEYDVGRTYTVTINGENGSAFNIPTGTTATVEGTLNGSVGFTQSATISNNQVSFALSESMTAYSGKAWCKIKLTLNNEPIQTCAFVLAVDRAGVEAETVIGAPGFEGQVQDAVDDYLAENPISVDQEQIQDAVDSWFDDHGGALTVDNVLSGTSENPVQNKVVTAALNNKGTYSKPSGGIPASDLASAVQTSLVKADTALQIAPVTSVNNKTGAVVLSASDVGAMPSSTSIPTKTSDLTNDSGFITAQDVPAAPVQSVNGKTGAVEINDVPDYSHATDGQVLTKTQYGPRWADSVPSSAASLRLLYDGTFGPDDPDLMLMGNLGRNLETAEAIRNALYSGKIGSAEFVDVTTSQEYVMYDLYSTSSENGVATVVFAREEADYIRTATLSGSTKAAPVFGKIPLGGLPAVTASDNGKFLRVSNGAWAAQAVPAAESNSFGGGA